MESKKLPSDGDFPNRFDTICLSHLRWNFVYQRPQHLLSRFTRFGRVFYWEEPVPTSGEAFLEVREEGENVVVCVPHLPAMSSAEATSVQKQMLDELIAANSINEYLLWFYTPMAMEFADDLQPLLTVFDCMDELSAFRFAPPELIANEKRLLQKADIVFTGGWSLYEAKKHSHRNIHAFPSSIDKEHFAKARSKPAAPRDQDSIQGQKLGFCGVIDERMNTALVAEIADLRPNWQIIMLGPVVKIAPEELPRRSNIHYLGGKKYEELPAYIGNWNVALMPFALNDSTKYISPTKTPEYLAAGKPVVSTPIRDVVTPYGTENLVEIAETAEEFVAAAEKLMAMGNHDEWQMRVDRFLEDISWDKTFAGMCEKIFSSRGHNSHDVASSA